MTIKIRSIDPASDQEVSLVATRMRETLVEVLGEEKGGSMYTMDWLEQRVRWHLNLENCLGEILLAEAESGHIAGHTILRKETESDGIEYGLFSTTYVEPASRGRGVASNLLTAGENWMRGHGLIEAVTFTDEFNTPLQELYAGHGYKMEAVENNFVKLSKELD